jgi:hypothetical protein
LHRFRGDIQTTQAVSFVLSSYIHRQQQKTLSAGKVNELQNAGISLQTFTASLTQMESLQVSYVL